MGLEGDEYRRLAGLSLLPNVRSRLLELAEEADRAEAAAKSTEAPAATTEPAAASAAGKPTAAAGFTKITSYAWDQDATKVKLHLTLPGVQQLPPEAIQARMTDAGGVEVLVHGLRGANHRLQLGQLAGKVVADRLALRQRTDRLVVVLPKDGAGSWPELTAAKKRAVDDKLKMDKDKDPSTAIMDLMRNMYEEGDDTTKRLIAESMTKARSGQAGNGLETPDF